MSRSTPLLSFFLIFLFFLPSSGPDEEWELRKDKNGIKVFTRNSETSKIKELRMTLKTDASLSNIISLLNDTEGYEDWAYRFEESKTLAHLTPTKSVYYGLVDFPWPLADRDIVATSEVHQDPTSRIVTVTTRALDEYPDAPLKKGVVRITEHFNQWRFEPRADGYVYIDYVLQSNPAGSIPTWAINMALDQGSSQSMELFLEKLPDEKYRNAEVPFIKELGE